MQSIETKIWMALRRHTETLLPSMSKAWPAIPFKPRPSAAYLRVGKIQIAPQKIQLAYGKPHERNGTLIITLVHPLNQPDPAIYEEIQGQIAAHFKDGTQMTYNGVCVNVPRYPHTVEGYEDNGWWTAPVTIPWRCFA